MKMTDRTTFGCAPGWKRYEGNPVLGREYGETYDVCVLQFGSVLRMYLSLRYSRSIGMTESRDGIHWGPVIPILQPEGEEDLNRPMVLQIDGMFYMWYTKMRCTEHPVKFSNVLAEICLAVSRDGIHFERQNRLGLTATEPWENEKVTCPFVREENGLFRMWYSGGGHWEPDHIGYAESHDGIHWEKSSLNPVFCPHPGHYWERGHTEACQVIFVQGWYYMFYLGMEDMYKGTVNVARSRDGVTDWERYRENPILRTGPCGEWDCEAVYKPWILNVGGKWMLWANGRKMGIERIGLYYYEHACLFPDWETDVPQKHE